MDPFTIITGVAGVAAVAIQSATALVALVKSIRGAVPELKALSRGVYDFHAVALSLQTVLMDTEMEAAISGDQAIVDIIETLERPLKSCQDLMTELMIKLHKQCRLRGENKSRRLKSPGVPWSLSIKSDMRELREHLETAKLTLCTALSAVNLLFNTRLFTRHDVRPVTASCLPSTKNMCVRISSSFDRQLASTPAEGYTCQALLGERMCVVAMKQSTLDFLTQTYFLVYAETIRRWRRIIISATFPTTVNGQLLLSVVSAPDTDDGSCKMLPAALQSLLTDLLPHLRLFGSVSRLCLNLTCSGRALSVTDSSEVEVTEDLLEKDMMNPVHFIQEIPDLKCETFLESDVAMLSRVSSTFYEVMLRGQRYVERKAPFASSGRKDENGFEDFMKDLRLAVTLRDCSGISRFIGVVLDDSGTYLKGYLSEAPAITNLFRVISFANLASETIPWTVRELWSQQIVNTVSEVHHRGLTLGTITRQSFALGVNGEVVLFRLHASHVHMQDKDGEMPPELRVPAGSSRMPSQTTNYRTDIFQLGHILWLLAEHKPNISTYKCVISACTAFPRFKCTASHTKPIAMPPTSPSTPPYMASMIAQCRSPDPRARPTAHTLAAGFPRPPSHTLTHDLQAIMKSFTTGTTSTTSAPTASNAGDHAVPSTTTATRAIPGISIFALFASRCAAAVSTRAIG